MGLASDRLFYAALAALLLRRSLVHHGVVEVLGALPEAVHVGSARDTDDILGLGAVLVDAVAEALDLRRALLLELAQAENSAASDTTEGALDALLIGAVGHRLGLVLARHGPVCVLVLEDALLVLCELLAAVFRQLRRHGCLRAATMLKETSMADQYAQKG